MCQKALILFKLRWEHPPSLQFSGGRPNIGVEGAVPLKISRQRAVIQHLEHYRVHLETIHRPTRVKSESKMDIHGGISLTEARCSRRRDQKQNGSLKNH